MRRFFEGVRLWLEVKVGVIIFGGTFSALQAKTSAGAHRLPGINFCSSHPETARYQTTQLIRYNCCQNGWLRSPPLPEAALAYFRRSFVWKRECYGTRIAYDFDALSQASHGQEDVVIDEFLI